MQKLLTIVVIAGAAGFGIWQVMKDRQQNNLREEGNAAVAEGNEAVKLAGEKFKALFVDSFYTGFPEKREQLGVQATELATLWEKASERFRAAAAKFEEMSKVEGDEVIKEYYTLRAQSVAKLADSKDAYRKIALAVLDDSIKDTAAFDEKTKPWIDEGEQLNKASEELGGKADKIEQYNKSKFKK